MKRCPKGTRRNKKTGECEPVVADVSKKRQKTLRSSSNASQPNHTPTQVLPTTIDILCWNICWGCMVANESSVNDVTASKLANKCQVLNTQTGSNVCLNNVVSVINSKKYGIIGLQEASNWNTIYDALNDSSLGYVHTSVYNTHKKVNVDIVTFYDATQFKILAVKAGDILKHVVNDDRPYHIIFLLHKTTNAHFIVINLHNGHNVKRVNLEKILGTRIDMAYLIDANSSQKNFSWSDKRPTNQGGMVFDTPTEQDISHIINGHNFNVVVMGDFNDHGKYDYWKKLMPFKYTSIPELNTISVTSVNQPPKTCCTGDFSVRTLKHNNDKLYGDYILINNSEHFNYSNVMRIPSSFINPSSDHLPVETQITFTIHPHSTQNQNIVLSENARSSEGFSLSENMVVLEETHLKYIKQTYAKYFDKRGNIVKQINVCDAVSEYTHIIDNYMNGLLRSSPTLYTLRNKNAIKLFNEMINVLDSYYTSNKCSVITQDMVNNKQNILYRGENKLCDDGSCRTGLIESYSSTSKKLQSAAPFTRKFGDYYCCLYEYELDIGVPFIDVNKIIKDPSLCSNGLRDNKYMFEEEVLLPRGIILTAPVETTKPVDKNKQKFYDELIKLEKKEMKNSTVYIYVAKKYGEEDADNLNQHHPDYNIYYNEYSRLPNKEQHEIMDEYYKNKDNIAQEKADLLKKYGYSNTNKPLYEPAIRTFRVKVKYDKTYIKNNPVDLMRRLQK